MTFCKQSFNECCNIIFISSLKVICPPDTFFVVFRQLFLYKNLIKDAAPIYSYFLLVH